MLTVISKIAESIAAVFVPDVQVAIAESEVVPAVPYFTATCHVAVPAAVFATPMRKRNREPTARSLVDNWNNEPETMLAEPAVSDAFACVAVAGVPTARLRYFSTPVGPTTSA